MDPNQRIIARFPFRDEIRLLTLNERTRTRIATDRIWQNLNGKLTTDVIKHSGNDVQLLRDMQHKANVFQSDEIPKVLPVDHRGDFDMAWHSPLAARLAFLINKLFEGRPLNALQIACNYGPLLWFIRKETGANIFGLDPNATAINFSYEVSTKYLLDMRRGTVQNIPFETGFFDVVISRHFLCSNYRPAYYGELTDDEQSIVAKELEANPDILLPHYLKILWQIDRVLAPGGYYISTYEDMLTPKTASLYFKKLIKTEGSDNILIAQK